MKEQSKGRSIVYLIVLVVLTVLSLYGGIKNMNNIKLGLDLNGGVSITYQAAEDNPSAVDMADTIYKIQKRVEGYSTESSVYQEGSNRINVDIPGVSDANQILQELGKPGSLIFATFNYDADGNISDIGDTVVEGSEIQSAGVAEHKGTNGAADSYEVGVTFTAEGTKKFADATTANVGKQIAIIYDNEVVSAPVVNEPITGGQCSITGNFTQDEAYNLAQTIRLGALKLELTELRSNVVGARLGQQAIELSLKAGLIGFICVVVLMLVVYRVAGLAASVALSMYVGLILILLDAFEITLTLPGIAGIILSVGMAVDANVIIFTSIKEELGLKKSVDEAIHSGFNKALSAIVDGNVTTLIAAVVIYLKGSGTVKGFAQTLALGIILSMVTALFVTRFMINALYWIGCDKPSMFGIKKPVEKPFNFTGKFKLFGAVSIAVILLGFAFMGINKGNTGDILNYGLDFKGGTSCNVTFNEDLSLDYISENVVPVVTESTGDMSPQVSKVAGTNEVLIRTLSLDAAGREALYDALAEKFGIDKELITAENISGSVSTEMKRDAIVAVVIATILMLLYIWFRFKNINFASSAVAALIHDVLVVLTFYSVLRWSVSSTFIACILTIVGYSINATIVIFDRIRRNLKTAPYGADVAGIVNLSIHETVSRTVFTSLTTFIMVFCLFVFGTSSIREFALPLMVGIICGGYSSVFITGPLWNLLDSRRRAAAAARKAEELASKKKKKQS
ncbi:MAG: protein translocase subunit SecD [Lachnospiraceae bacterium]|nr:protein translocase subunit SecD [Lachnospiraceae bacterium]